MREFEGRTAVVTGGGSGIGRGIAVACAERGMNVVVADIEAAAAEETAAQVRALGPEALAVGTDVSDRASVDALADAAYGRFGEVHLLFNNAGVLVSSRFEETTAADVQWMLSVNLFGVLHGVQAFLPRMKAQPGEKHIVNTSSMSGLVTGRGSGLSGYVATKFAVVGLTEAMQRELEPLGVRVSLFCPGATETRISEAERNRPAAFGPAHSRRPEPRPAGPTAATPDRRQEPLEVGRRVLEGVALDRRYIFTHPEPRTLVEARMRGLLEAFEWPAGEEK